MEIKKGYKQSSVGLIPNDWVVKKIKDISPLQRGFDLPNQALIEGEYPVVYSNGVQSHHIKFQAKAPGIVTGRSGTIGKVTYVEEDYWPHNTSLWVTDFKNNEPKFVYYLFLKTKLERFATGSGVPTLNRNDVHDFLVAIPPTKSEQTAIATALSDADNYITHLEKLIAKKRMVKQGAMQELLKPKEGWEMKNLVELCLEIGDGIHATPEYVDSSEYFFVNGNNLVDGEILIFKDTKCISLSEFKFLKKNLNNQTILMSINGTIGNLAFYNDENIVLGKSAAYIKLIDSIEKYFIYYFLQHSSVKEYYGNELTGTTIRNLSLRTIRETPIPLPNTEEQTHIANILSDMDTEIATIEKKLEKARQIKQGMMQQLLTGKIRLA